MAENTPVQEKPYNLDANVEAMLCYLPYIGLFTSLAIFIMEKKNAFVRFHAMQGLLFAAGYTVLTMILSATLILIWVVPVVSTLAFVIWLFMMWKSYSNEEYSLPFIGKIARDQLSKIK